MNAGTRDANHEGDDEEGILLDRQALGPAKDGGDAEDNEEQASIEEASAPRSRYRCVLSVAQ